MLRGKVAHYHYLLLRKLPTFILDLQENEELIKISVRDANPEARNYGRKCFIEFKRHFHKEGMKLYEEFDQKTKKMIEDEIKNPVKDLSMMG
jgi:hypothetical protein